MNSPSSTQTSEVSILIRHPASHINDVRIDCPISASVLYLKEEISKLYPDRPAPSNQKLFFAGKILSDQSILQDVLKHQDKTRSVTFHLVVSNFPNATFTPVPSFQQFPTPAPTNAFPNVPPNVPPVPFPMNQPGNVHFPPPRANHAHVNFNLNVNGRQLNIFHQYNISTLLKLAFLVLLLSQGLSNERLMLLIFGCILIYLYQIGRLKLIMFTRFFIPIHPPLQPDHPTETNTATSAHFSQQQPLQQNTFSAKLINEVVFNIFFPFFASLVPSYEIPRRQPPQQQQQQQQQQQR